MKKNYLLMALLMFALTGCQTPQTSTPAQPTQISCTIPKIAIVADPVNKETQSKGGLDITVMPALYKGLRIDHTTVTQIPAPLGVQISMGLSGQTSQNSVYVERDTTSELKPSPSRLEFTVKIHNTLNRVFHGQGSVVQFNVDGTLIPFNNTDYKEFTGGIVPPLNDGDFKILGPPLSSLKDKGTITVFVYDVVTQTDVAGNTTEKQNYTWDFTYAMQQVSDSGVDKKEQVTISPADYQQIMMRQNMQQMNQMQGGAQENSAQ